MSDSYDDLWDDPKPKPKPSLTEGVEKGLLIAANGIWAVVGLFLWLPQLARVLVTTTVRVLHSGLTRQPLESVRGPIRRVSRFYTRAFLEPKAGAGEGVYAARDPLVRRFIGEGLWAVLFYGLLLRLLSPDTYERWAEALAGLASRLGAWLRDLATAAAAHLPDSWQALVALERGPVLVLVVLFVLAFAGGWWLARR